ncbi:MAG: hypothetical protein JSW58_02590 [Candidatus Latescibacterota bacterium]|nr:MAG: hypothetical protein JSW58_02590 [Candidatus Latescibacterota bacterium]
MSRNIKQILLHLVVVSSVLLPACSDETDIIDPSEKLCRGASGLGARISGPEPIEMCVSDQETSTEYVPPGHGLPVSHYETVSVYSAGGLTIEIQTQFFEQDIWPRTLNITGNLAEAEADPDAAWFFYRETKEGEYEYTSATVTGAFTLTFNDQFVAVATFSNLEILLEDTATQTDAGMRRISEGYISVNVDSSQ